MNSYLETGILTFEYEKKSLTVKPCPERDMTSLLEYCTKSYGCLSFEWNVKLKFNFF